MHPILLLIFATVVGLKELITADAALWEIFVWPVSTGLVLGWLTVLIYSPLGISDWLLRMSDKTLEAVDGQPYPGRGTLAIYVDYALLAGCASSMCFAIWCGSTALGQKSYMLLFLAAFVAPLSGICILVLEWLERRMVDQTAQMIRAFQTLEVKEESSP